MQSSVSVKGQVTLPVEVRRRLGLNPRDRVRFTIEDGEVKLCRVPSVLATSYQAVPPLDPPRSPEEAIRIAVEEHARQTAMEGR